MGDIEIPANQLTGIRKKLADQLKTVFAMCLLVFGLAAVNLGGNAPSKRLAWYPFVIFTAIFLVYYFGRGRKKVAVNPRYIRWIIPFFIVAVIWLYYGVSGISLSKDGLIWIGVCMLIWSSILLLSLFWIMNEWGVKRKPTKTIIWFVKNGNYAYWPLSIVVLLASVILGCAKLWDAGERGWWTYALFYLGVLLAFVVPLVQLNNDRKS